MNGVSAAGNDLEIVKLFSAVEKEEQGLDVTGMEEVGDDVALEAEMVCEEDMPF